MPKRSSKPKDVNQLAHAITEQATKGKPKPKKKPAKKPQKNGVPEKNPAAVTLGRLGGLKGGPARAANLSPKKLREIAKKGAIARWGDEQKPK